MSQGTDAAWHRDKRGARLSANRSFSSGYPGFGEYRDESRGQDDIVPCWLYNSGPPKISGSKDGRRPFGRACADSKHFSCFMNGAVDHELRRDEHERGHEHEPVAKSRSSSPHQSHRRVVIIGAPLSNMRVASLSLRREFADSRKGVDRPRKDAKAVDNIRCRVSSVAPLSRRRRSGVNGCDHARFLLIVRRG